jgi:hypothetical protein
MNYIALLASAVRLLDLHDSNRGYGEADSFSREKRPGQSDGIYLDIAWLVIERLKQHDDAAYQEYLPFSMILGHVRATRPDVNENDIAYVLGVMRRPTELFYISRDNGAAERHSEKRKTALIEKIDYADEYRLSATGRGIPGLANAARNATYVRGDAYNLLHAVEGLDFQEIPNFADEIVSQLRAEILNIHAAIERIGRVDAVNAYIKNFEQWKNIIADTIQIVSRTEERLDSTAFRERLEAWLDDDSNKSSLTFIKLHNEVLRIRQVLTTFNRLQSDLVQIAMRERRNAVAPPSFRDFAVQLVRNPFSSRAEEHFFRQWGACKLETPFHSVFDGLAAVSIREVSPQASAPVFADELIEAASDIGKLRFLDARGKEIAARLQAGPLSLSSAIADGLFVVDSDVLIGDLVGVFVMPEALPLDGTIEIRLAHGLHRTQLGLDDYLFTDVELVLKEDAA